MLRDTWTPLGPSAQDSKVTPSHAFCEASPGPKVTASHAFCEALGKEAEGRRNAGLTPSSARCPILATQPQSEKMPLGLAQPAGQ